MPPFTRRRFLGHSGATLASAALQPAHAAAVPAPRALDTRFYGLRRTAHDCQAINALKKWQLRWLFWWPPTFNSASTARSASLPNDAGSWRVDQISSGSRLNSRMLAEHLDFGIRSGSNSPSASFNAVGGEPFDSAPPLPIVTAKPQSYRDCRNQYFEKTCLSPEFSVN